MTSRSQRQELSEKFTEQWQRSCDWLVQFMQRGQPRLLTKSEFRSVAMRELNVSKNAFDFEWVAAIEETGRHEWYEPVCRRPRLKNWCFSKKTPPVGEARASVTLASIKPRQWTPFGAS